MPRINAFHHVALHAADFDATVAFYTDALGLTPIYAWEQSPKRAVILRCGDDPTAGHVEIFEKPDVDPTSPAAQPEARLMHFALHTDDVDAMHAKALAAGATERMAPRDVELVNTRHAHDDALPPHFAPRISFVVSPNGEIVEFFTDPLCA
jgi:catechol 2,3-dioxygenase-like lactoylglutathione lyase family enzyme